MPKGKESKGWPPSQSSFRKRSSPYEQCNWLGRCFYLFLWPLNVKVQKWRPFLRSGDFDGHIPAKWAAADSLEQLERNWHFELKCKQEKSSFARAVAQTYGPKYVSMSLLLLLSECLFEPMYFYFSIQLIDTIGLYRQAEVTLSPSGALPANWTSSGSGSSLGAGNKTELALQQETEAPGQETASLAELRAQLLLNAFGLVLGLAGASLAARPFAWYTGELALRMRAAITQMVYKKSLRMDKVRAKQEAGVHCKQAISLISRDVEMLELCLSQLPWVASGLLQCLLLSSIISQSLDVQTALVALLLTCLVAVQRAHVNFARRKQARATSKMADKRVALTSEALDAIKIVKMYAWTGPIERRICEQRRAELGQRKRIVFATCMDNFLFHATCSGIAILTLIFGHSVRGLPMSQKNISQVFLVSSIFRRTLSRYLPQGLLAWINVGIVFSRCGKYLRAAEMNESRLSIGLAPTATPLGAEGSSELTSRQTLTVETQTQTEALPVDAVCTGSAAVSSGGSKGGQTAAIVATDLGFSWPSDEEQERAAKTRGPLARLKLKRKRQDANQEVFPPGRRCCLAGVNFSLSPGELMIVSGRVGSGKSTLMQLILGELTPTCGSIQFGPAGGKGGARGSQQGGGSSGGGQCALAYAPQEAWVFAGSVRDNILLGRALDLGRYVRVLRACCLLPDLLAFGQFDRTLVGERGVTLSGGQKARLNLARALYQPADLYLLDDPLSAVDANVARHIFRRALRHFLADKAVILVTHQVQYLREAHKLLLLSSGSGSLQTSSAAHFGTYAQLRAAGLLGDTSASTSAAPSAPIGQPEALAEPPPSSGAPEAEESPLATQQFAGQLNKLDGAQLSDDYIERRILSDQLDEQPDERWAAPSELAQVLQQQGERSASSVWRAYVFYVSACSLPLYCCFYVALLLCRTSYSSAGLWLNYWAGVRQQQRALALERSAGLGAELAEIEALQVAPQGELQVAPGATFSGSLERFVGSLDVGGAFWGTGAIWLFIVAAALTQSSLLYRLTLRGARRIHDSLVASILWTSLHFFDRTPHGHLLNRLSSDIGHMDTAHTQQMDEMAHCFAVIVFSLVTILLSMPTILPFLLLALLSVALLFRHLAPLIEIVKRLDGFRRAAIYSHASTTLNGLPVLRAAKRQQLFQLQLQAIQDRHSSVHFLNLSLRRLVNGALDSTLVCFYAVLVLLYVRDTLGGQGQLAFVGLNLIVQLTRLCQLGFSRFVEFYSTVQALDRIRDYSQLEPEPNLDLVSAPMEVSSSDRKQTGGRLENSSAALGKLHVSRGEVEFVGVSLCYEGAGKLVLRDLSFGVRAGERIGIAGRTGAGKSSLISVLFRLYHFEGFVFIDGQNTKQLELDSLRSAISIIPQDPVLFTGSIRYNLDPFGEHEDAQLWQAIQAVHLDELLAGGASCPQAGDEHQLQESSGSAGSSGLAGSSGSGGSSGLAGSRGGLEMEVSESGANLSLGQRQLVCLARAILRDNKLLILDEATANIDRETDRLIQQAIRRKFNHCTIFTVAHRLETIIDSDRVMVIDEGRLCEFASPRELAQQRSPKSMFLQMIESTGEKQASLLLEKLNL